MLRSFIFHLRYFYHKKLRQTHRISHKTLEFVCLLIGATFVALFSFGFAKLADIGLEFNAYWSAKYPLAVWIVNKVVLNTALNVLKLNGTPLSKAKRLN